MRILVVGATGTIGQAVVAALAPRHEVIPASHSKAKIKVDVTDTKSIEAMFAAVGRVDAVVSLSGGARFAPIEKLTDEDYAYSLANKLMGQVNLARAALAHIADGGSITLTSGVLAWHPMPGSAAISLVNAGLEGFTAGAAHEGVRHIRVNVVSPPWVTETLAAMKWSLPGAKSATDVARLYTEAVESHNSGHVIAFAGDAVRSTPLSAR